ncbi:MAG: undecaprenyl-diphosphate phosphatase [Ruminococcaceae bacterium]|nr:undecaprenyl-diphosphate phosphatase [Oscillospiraceae bacterium]
MTTFIELIKTVLYGILEGITEWLPISSTGHLILLEEILPLNVSEEFFEMFEVVIQLGASLAVLGLYLGTLLPNFKTLKTKNFLTAPENKRTFTLWGKIIVAVIPSAVIGLLLDDWFDAHFYNAPTVAAALAFYGVIYIIIESVRKNRNNDMGDVHSISYAKAFGMGCFQVLALIPGTSRSGSTILGGLLLGLSRTAAAEMSFFLALPTMLGASALKALKFVLGGTPISGTEIAILIVGCVVSYLVSVVAIKFLMGFVKKHTFIPFGIYRIALAVLVLAYFFLIK